MIQRAETASKLILEALDSGPTEVGDTNRAKLLAIEGGHNIVQSCCQEISISL